MQQPTTLSPVRARMNDVFVLAKVRLNTLVVLTTAGGYYMAAPGDVSPVALVLTCLGTGLVAGGAAAINQVQERDLDRLMIRTRMRPIAEERLTPIEGFAIGGSMAAAGLMVLALGTNLVAAAIALATLLT